MFRFPWKDPDRLEVWLNNCGNMTITHLPREKLRSRYICIDHFQNKYIRSATDVRKTLRRQAIPEPYQNPEVDTTSQNHSPSHLPGSSSSPASLKVLTPQRVYVNKKRILAETHKSDTEAENEEQLYTTSPKKRKTVDTPKCKKLKTLLVKSNKSLKRQIIKNKSLKNKNFIDLSKHTFKSESSKLITNLQLRLKQKQFTQEEKKICMSLYRVETISDLTRLFLNYT